MKRTIGLISLLLIVLASHLVGQSSTSLRGTVTDLTGAVIPGATLTVTNLATQASRSGNSGEDGSFSFPAMTPGSYQLRASAAGFNDVIINDLRLLVNVPATQNVQFEKIGTVAETISVSAEAMQLNTTDASLGNAMGTKAIVELPANARNVVGLLALQPGVLYIREDGAQARNDPRSGNVNGARNDQSNVTLDGVDVNDQIDRGPFTSVLRVTLDSVQEFRTTTLNATADQGRSSGAQVSLVTKGGSNEVHGSAYWFHRNTVTTANDFFLNSTGIERPKLIRNIGGASLGGPIVRNRVFLFGNWEYRRDAREDNVLRTVPSMEMRQGILQYLDTNGSVRQVTPAMIRSQIDPLGIGVSQSALAVLQAYPMPNDFTAGDGLNQVGFRFKAPVGLRWNTYVSKMDFVLDRENKHTAFIRANLQNDNETRLPQFPGQPPNSVGLNNSKGLAIGSTSVLLPTLVNDFRFGYTRQGIEDTGIAKFAPVTFRNLSDPVGLSRGFRALIPVYTISNATTWNKGSHTVNFGFVFRGVKNDRLTDQNSWSSASTNASWLSGQGADLNAPFTDMDPNFRVSFRDAAMAAIGVVSQGDAQFNYLTDGTVLPEGAPVARLFKNNEYEFFVSDSWRVRPSLTITAGLRWSLMPPVEELNDQQLSSDIPLSSWFGLRELLASQGRSQSEVPAISFVTKDDPRWRPLYPYHKKNFAPRLGIAWSPGFESGLGKFLFGGAGKTSIRAGAGMFYDIFGQGLLRRFDATAFGLSNSLTNPSASLTLATAPRFQGVDQIPGGILPPAPPATFPATFPDIFAITNSIDDSIVPPYSMTLNFNIARDFGKGWFSQIGYVGRLGRRLLTQTDLAMPTNIRDPKSGMTFFEAAEMTARLVNAPDFDPSAAPSAAIPFWENMFPGFTEAGRTPTHNAMIRYWANAPDYTFALFQMDVSCASRNRCSSTGPFSLFNSQYSFLSAWRNMGNSDYHALQYNLRKNWTNGDLLDFNYTWSKAIDLSSTAERATTTSGVIINPWFPGLRRGVSDFDTTHQLTANGLYTLPFGTGKRFMTNAGGFMNALLGGWQLSGIWRMTSGFATGAGNGRFWPTNWNITGLARSVATPPEAGSFKNAPAIAGGSGPNLFANPAAAIQAWDNELPGGVGSRNIVRGDGVFQLDTNLAKSFQMPWNEGHRLQFRWEAFNLLNNVRFDVWDLSMDLGNSGSFGRYSSTLGGARVMQFGLRYDF